MARITVKAFAELMNAPGYSQLRILSEQKYPRRAPALYQVPYYAATMRAIRQYYRHGGDLGRIDKAIIDLQAANPNPKRANNVRALQAFRSGSQIHRRGTVRPIKRRSFRFGVVEIRVSPDIIIEESKGLRYLLYNFKQYDPADEIIRTTLELVYYILHESGVQCRLNDCEYMCLQSDRTIRHTRFRNRTLERAMQTAQMVATLWDSL